jgi:hypothetical protein
LAANQPSGLLGFHFQQKAFFKFVFLYGDDEAEGRENFSKDFFGLRGHRCLMVDG